MQIMVRVNRYQFAFRLKIINDGLHVLAGERQASRFAVFDNRIFSDFEQRPFDRNAVFVALDSGGFRAQHDPVMQQQLPGPYSLDFHIETPFQLE